MDEQKLAALIKENPYAWGKRAVPKQAPCAGCGEIASIQGSTQNWLSTHLKRGELLYICPLCWLRLFWGEDHPSGVGEIYEDDRICKPGEPEIIIYSRRPFCDWDVMVTYSGTRREDITAVFRTGWAESQEVELFTLMPTEGAAILVRVQMFRTKVDVAAWVPTVVTVIRTERRVNIDLIAEVSMVGAPGDRKLRVSIPENYDW